MWSETLSNCFHQEFVKFCTKLSKFLIKYHNVWVEPKAFENTSSFALLMTYGAPLRAIHVNTKNTWNLWLIVLRFKCCLLKILSSPHISFFKENVRLQETFISDEPKVSPCSHALTLSDWLLWEREARKGACQNFMTSYCLISSTDAF